LRKSGSGFAANFGRSTLGRVTWSPERNCNHPAARTLSISGTILLDREYMNMRKSMIALAAAMALGTATISTAAMAQHHGGGGFAGGGGGGAHMGGGGGGGFGGGARMGGGGGFGGGAAMAHGGAGFAGGGAGFARPAGPSNFGGNRGNFAGTPGNVAGARGNFAARGFDRDHDRHHGFRGFGFGGLYAFSGPGYYDDNAYDDYSGDSCWQRQLVPTPYGLQWRLVDVCE
jgi:hypothetical protein